MSRDLIKYSPFTELSSFQHDMNRLFSDFLGRAPDRRNLSDGLWAPMMDIEETRTDIIVKAEIPGMKKEDIKIQISGGMLTISGERKHEEETKDKTYHRIERMYGQFQRVLRLPAEVQSGRTRAAYENGLLTITVPKAEEGKPKEIAIEVK